MVLPSDTILYHGTNTVFFVRGIMKEKYVECHVITMFFYLHIFCTITIVIPLYTLKLLHIMLYEQGSQSVLW